MTIEEAKHRRACRRAWVWLYWKVINPSPFIYQPAARTPHDAIDKASDFGHKLLQFRP